MRLKQPKNPQIRIDKDPRPQQVIPSEATRMIASLIRPAPKPHEELRLGRSKGQIGPKSLPPRRGAAK
jgi:hypothetical protein